MTGKNSERDGVDRGNACQEAARACAWPPCINREKQEMRPQENREDLKQLVLERTAELHESNRRLRKEIAERQQAEALLREREQQYRDIFVNTSDGIALLEATADRRFRFISINPTFERIAQITSADLAGKYIEDYFPADVAQQLTAIFLRCVELGIGMDYDSEYLWPSGLRIDNTTAVPIRDDQQRIHRVAVISRDITERRELERTLRQRAFHDALTGLPNRLLLSDRISRSIADAGDHGHQFGLMMLDLDHFKEVNDTLGHGVGDRLLAEVASRMQAGVRACDTVARLGGDEFAILLPDVRRGDDLAEMARKILRQFDEPFLIDGRELFVTTSIGIALYPDDSDSIDALYKYADSAMYHAKKMGRNNFQFYAREFTLRLLERMETEAALRKAQKHGELALHYQPQIELQSGRLIGAEALLRWNRPDHGLVGPDCFIRLAEESGLIVDIGEWVLASACRSAVSWNRKRKNPVRIAVNVSTRQFVRNDLAGTVSRILSETGCSPAWLELEITESLLIEDSPDTASTLEALHRMGISIAIDDFGTGYSALSYLHRFPVRQIKIDRSFVQGVPAQRDKRELTRAMLSIAAALGLETVAEGVESPQQADYLLAHGCRQAQGYLFGQPMPAAEFEAVLARNGDMPSF